MIVELNSELFYSKIDSLFVNKAFNILLEECRNSLNKPDLEEMSYMGLVSTLFLQGKTKESDQYLRTYLITHREHILQSNPGWLSLSPFPNGSAVVQSYLKNHQNTGKVESSIINAYKTEKNPLTKEGIEILKDIIVDQHIRGLYIMQLNSLKRTGLPNKSALNSFIQADTVCRKTVSAFFRKQGRIFSRDEIGSVFSYQFLLFAHETDMMTRQLYLKYIKAAVKENICEADKIISFIMRSEIIEGKFPTWFDEAFNKRIEELKTEYNYPEYTFDIE